MSNQKIEPCQKCSSNDVTVYKYDSGWRHVECDECFYLGPGEGSIREAIRSHNRPIRADRHCREVFAENIKYGGMP